MKQLSGTLVLLFCSSACLAQTLGDALNPTLVWSSGGAVVWEVTTNATHDGVAAAQSGIITDYRQESWIQTTVTGPAAVSFWWKVAAAEDYTYLQLYVGGAIQTQITGHSPWLQRSFYVPAGTQPVRWRFFQEPLSTAEQRAWLDEVSVTTAIAAAIVVNPTNQTILAGDSATLVAAATGTEPLSYQWIKNGTPLAFATNSVLSFVNAQSANTGDYSLAVVNPLGSVTSQVATLTVVPATPVFTTHPIAQGAPELASVTFSAAAKGSLPISWQWYSNEVAIPGRTASSYSIPSVRSNYYADYFVVAGNSEGATTSIVARLNYSPVVAWGDNTYGQNVIPSAATNVIDLCGGDYHCLALRDDGQVVAWGTNSWASYRYDQASVPPNATNAVAIAAGSAHSLAAREDGTVLKWGHIIGDFFEDVPDEVTNIVSLAQGTGAQHALALRADGTVVEWGNTNHNLLPIPPGLSNIVAVAAGAYHSLALRADGSVVSWGWEWSYEYPQEVPPAATNVVAIACGWFHNLALRADGKIVAWGRGKMSSTSVTNVPASATNVIAIACGPSFSYALRRNGTVVAWGDSLRATPAWVTNVSVAVGTGVNSLAILAQGPPRLCGPLVERTVPAGSNAFFYARAVGATPLSWQWQRDGVDIPGATNPWLALPAVQTYASGLYSVTVSNAFGVATNSAALHVLPDLRIVLTSQIGTNSWFSLSGTGQTGLVWTVQRSSDLSTWLSLSTITNTTGTLNYIDETNESHRFYRLKLAP